MKAAIWVLFFFFIYPYLIYPLILKFLPKKQKSLSTPEKWPKVTLLIAAYNEEKLIRDKLENSLLLDYPDLEIVVVSDGSTDKTNEILTEYNEIETVFLSKREGKPKALEAGVNKATGDIICFSDVSAFLSANSLKALIKNLLLEDVGACGGVLSLKKFPRQSLGESFYSQYETKLRALETETGKNSTIVLPGAFYAVKKHDLILPPENIIADDFYITCSLLKKNKRLIQVDEAIAWEQSVYSTSEEFIRKARIIAGGIQTMSLFSTLVWGPWGFFLISHKILRWAAAFIGIIHYLLLLSSGLYTPLLAVESLFIALGLLSLIAEKLGVATPRFFALCRHFLVVNTAVIFGFIGLMTGRQSVKWTR